MSRRTQDKLLRLEVQILEAAERAATTSRSGPLYGFSLAKALAEDGGKSLVAHGTLYKALSRLTAAGMLDAEWEDADAAASERRPRRRHYVLTAKGVTALATSRVLERTPDRISTFRPVQP
jgi:PadR family transcriptional regulator, regulatory protein PadR